MFVQQKWGNGMAGKRPGRPKKERPEGATENDKIWGVRGVDEETKHFIRWYAFAHDISVGEAIKEIAILARTVEGIRRVANKRLASITKLPDGIPSPLAVFWQSFEEEVDAIRRLSGKDTAPISDRYTVLPPRNTGNPLELPLLHYVSLGEKWELEGRIRQWQDQERFNQWVDERAARGEKLDPKWLEEYESYLEQLSQHQKLDE